MNQFELLYIILLAGGEKQDPRRVCIAHPQRPVQIFEVQVRL